MNELDYIKRQLELKKDNIDCLVSKKYEIDSKIGKIHDEIELLEIEATNKILESKGLDYEFSIDLTKIIDGSVIFSAKSSEDIFFKITDSPILKNFENPDNVYLSLNCIKINWSTFDKAYGFRISEINENGNPTLIKTYYTQLIEYFEYFSQYYIIYYSSFGYGIGGDSKPVTNVVFKIDESTISIDE